MKETRIHGRGGQGSLVLAQFMAIAALEDGQYGQAFPFLGGGGERRGKPIMAFCRLSDQPIRLRSRVSEPDYITNGGGTIYDTDRLGVGGVSHERGKEKVSRIYDNMNRVFKIADRDKIPTYLAADRMAEERIKQIAEVKKYRDDLKP